MPISHQLESKAQRIRFIYYSRGGFFSQSCLPLTLPPYWFFRATFHGEVGRFVGLLGLFPLLWSFSGHIKFHGSVDSSVAFRATASQLSWRLLKPSLQPGERKEPVRHLRCVDEGIKALPR